MNLPQKCHHDGYEPSKAKLAFFWWLENVRNLTLLHCPLPLLGCSWSLGYFSALRSICPEVYSARLLHQTSTLHALLETPTTMRTNLFSHTFLKGSYMFLDFFSHFALRKAIHALPLVFCIFSFH